MFDVLFDDDLDGMAYAVLSRPNGDMRLVINPHLTGEMPVWLREHLVRSITRRICSKRPTERAGLAQVIDLTEARSLRAQVVHTGTCR